MKKGTGFGAPAIGKVLPKGSTFKRRKDGRIEVVTPKKAKPDKKK